MLRQAYGTSGSTAGAPPRARLAAIAPPRISTPPATTPGRIGWSRNRNASTVAASGSVAATTAVRTGPSRRSPANRQTNAAAVAAPIPASGAEGERHAEPLDGEPAAGQDHERRAGDRRGQAQQDYPPRRALPERHRTRRDHDGIGEEQQRHRGRLAVLHRQEEQRRLHRVPGDRQDRQAEPLPPLGQER